MSFYVGQKIKAIDDCQYADIYLDIGRIYTVRDIVRNFFDLHCDGDGLGGDGLLLEEVVGEVYDGGEELYSSDSFVRVGLTASYLFGHDSRTVELAQ